MQIKTIYLFTVPFAFFFFFTKGTDSSTSAKYENILFLVSTLIFFMCTN